MNTLPWPRTEVVRLPAAQQEGGCRRQAAGRDLQYALVQVPPMGSSPAQAITPTHPVTVGRCYCSY